MANKFGINISISDFSFFAFNKRWPNLRKCCIHYNVRYSSVVSYKNKYQCTNEEAIKHFTDSRKEKEIHFKKKKWPSLTECCKSYSLDPACVRAYKKEHNLTIEDALNEYYAMIQNRQFIFNKKVYRSFESCCRIHNVNPSSVKYYARKNHFLFRHALTRYLEIKNESIFLYKGKEYPTFSACCTTYDVDYYQVRDISFRTGITKEEALELSIKECINHYMIEYEVSAEQFEKIYVESIKEKGFLYKGKLYSSLAVACKKYDISEQLIHNYAKRKRLFLHHALDKCLKLERESKERLLKSSKSHKQIHYYSKRNPVIFRGNRFLSIADCCSVYQVDPANVRDYIRRHNCSIQDGLEMYLCGIADYRGNYGNEMNTARSIPFRNSIYKNLVECCEQYNVNWNSVTSYSSKANCSKQEALEYYIQLYEERKVTYNGITYNSLRECCETLKIDRKKVTNYAFYYKISFAEAIDYLLAPKENSYFLYEGKEYSSVVECCKEYGIISASVHSYLYRNRSATIQNAIDYIREITDKTRFIWKDGVTYRSFAVFCKEKGISVSSARDKARKNKISLAEAAEYYIQKKDTSLKNFDYEGKMYSSIPKCCAEYQIVAASVYAYLYKHPSSKISEAIDYVRQLKLKKKFLWKDGTLYDSFPEFCREKGINPNSVRNKAKFNKITIWEAAEHFISKNAVSSETA